MMYKRLSAVFFVCVRNALDPNRFMIVKKKVHELCISQNPEFKLSQPE